MTSPHQKLSFPSPIRLEARILAWLDKEGIVQVSPGDKKQEYFNQRKMQTSSFPSIPLSLKDNIKGKERGGIGGIGASCIMKRRNTMKV